MSILQESGVVMLLQRAVELDNSGKYKEALPCYENGYLYSLNREVNGKSYWRCDERKCPSQMISVGMNVVKNPGTHPLHAPSASKILSAMTMSNIRLIATETDEPIENIVRCAKALTSTSIASQLPSEEAVKQRIRRTRKALTKNNTAISANHEKCDEVFEFSNYLRQTLNDTNDESMKVSLREKFEQYMGRAELLKKLLKKDNNYQSEIIQIQCDSTSHSYEQVFGKYLDERVTEVEVIDPYIRSNHQVANFVRLCELLVKSTQVKRISLTTGKESDQGAAQAQMMKLSELKESLLKRNIKLDVEYSQTLHDREIRLNNGWTIKIGRGLDYFKAAESKFSIGMYDMNLRTCHETTVNIFHVNSVAKT